MLPHRVLTRYVTSTRPQNRIVMDLMALLWTGSGVPIVPPFAGGPGIRRRA